MSQEYSSAAGSAAARAEQSAGTTNSSIIYDLVCELIAPRASGPARLLDVGCGQGQFYQVVRRLGVSYTGVDVLRYDRFPADPAVDFIQADLEKGLTAVPADSADFVCSLETIEHVENPRFLMRELVRVLRPGGWLVVTTPNQLSLLSKACLVWKNEFVQFQERPGLYPSHLSALLEIDLVRMARENRLNSVEILYTGDGRMPGTARHWPRWLSARTGWRARWFSDNVLLVARKP